MLTWAHWRSKTSCSSSETSRNYTRTGKKKQIGKVEGENKDSSYFTNNLGEENAPTEKQLEEIKMQFIKVIPVDVITYREDNGDGHIGIITNINFKGIMEAQSIVSIMDNIQVIESNFGSYVNYVFKRQIMKGLGAEYKINGKTFYKGSWFLDWDTEANIRNFYIERLTVEEKQ